MNNWKLTFPASFEVYPAGASIHRQFSAPPLHFAAHRLSSPAQRDQGLLQNRIFLPLPSCLLSGLQALLKAALSGPALLFFLKHFPVSLSAGEKKPESFSWLSGCMRQRLQKGGGIWQPPKAGNRSYTHKLTRCRLKSESFLQARGEALYHFQLLWA